MRSLVVACAVFFFSACPEEPAEGEGEGGEGEGEGEEGEGEAVSFSCDDKSRELLAVTVAPGWILRASFVPDARIADVDRFFARPSDHAVGAYSPTTGLIESWGVWPRIAPTGIVADVIHPNHRVNGVTTVFPSRSAAFDFNLLVLTYAVDLGSEVQGGLFMEGIGVFLAQDPTSARRVGLGRVLVGAVGLFGNGTGLPKGTPQQLLAFDFAFFVPFELAHLDGSNVQIATAGDDFFVSTLSPAPATFRFNPTDLQTGAPPLVVPAPLAATAVSDVVDYEEDDDGMVRKLSGGDVEVWRFAGKGADEQLAIESPFLIDARCTQVTHSFTVGDDVVIAVLDTQTQERRFLSATPRCGVGVTGAGCE